ncbi:MAG: DUF1028 domain-containing protein [Candidatus Eremiobacteraeota bacterium]|nr:DUF1028 domain-containing protein [Candidatus Eremiobacteraeota bacterium]
MRPSTFSIVAADVASHEIGVAVQSKFLSVGAAVPWASADAGAVATQAWANTAYGPRGLQLLRDGLEPQQVIASLTAEDPQKDDRQIGVVGKDARCATFTGTRCMEWAGGVAGEGFAAQGNILAGPAVVTAMGDAFTAARGSLADRLIAALRAGQKVGGDRRGQQSAALLIVKPEGGYGGFNDRYVDLRVDDHPEPIEELARILELHKLYFFPPEPRDVLPIDAGLGREIAALLARAGELPAGAAFDDAARATLVKFMHRENLENRVREDGTIDRQTLDYLKNAAERC